ncbi:MAG: hypothetical protein RR290_04165 [Clostridia bacterium]
MEKFNQSKYIQRYIKDTYKPVKFVLKNDEYIDFRKKLKEYNFGITDFFKLCIKNIDKIKDFT